MKGHVSINTGTKLTALLIGFFRCQPSANFIVSVISDPFQLRAAWQGFSVDNDAVYVFRDDHFQTNFDTILSLGQRID